MIELIPCRCGGKGKGCYGRGLFENEYQIECEICGLFVLSLNEITAAEEWNKAMEVKDAKENTAEKNQKRCIYAFNNG